MSEDVAMQMRCLNCLMEQYAMNVIAVSNGEGGCSFCGAMSKPMTEAEYRTALRERREAEHGRGIK